jgi:hypothetical protein
VTLYLLVRIPSGACIERLVMLTQLESKQLEETPKNLVLFVCLRTVKACLKGIIRLTAIN